jgi:hypothetical protein
MLSCWMLTWQFLLALALPLVVLLVMAAMPSHGSGTGRAFGPGFTTGDVVGALLDRGLNTISYYK